MPVLSCARGHDNRPDLERCLTCGLPLVDYDEEAKALLRRFKGRLGSFRFAVEKILLGVGTAGKGIIHEFSHATAKTPGAVYLTVDAAEEKDTGKGKTPYIPGRNYVFRDYPPGGGLYCHIGRQVALRDEGLTGFLKNAGISQGDEHQNIIVVAATGGGTGSGAGPAVIYKAKDINPWAHTFAVAVTPSNVETDRYHFNAYYGVSSLLHFEDKPNADVIVVLNYDELRRVTGVGPSGEEIKTEGLVIAMLRMLGLDIGHAGATRLARLSQDLGIQAYVPCLGMGRSMEIFGSLPNILESAVLLPMSPVDRANVMVAYLLIRVPNRLSDVLTDRVINELFDSWAKANFPRLKASLCLITRLEEMSDRISVCILLGGDSLDNALGETKKGFQRFWTYLQKAGQLERIGLDNPTLETISRNIDFYNNNLLRWRS
ncbi:MAG: hypothetical protein HY673_19145 [Chloroflexi bacterium]|nr:hypothetical protein [Chloroflexota bacterium]